MQSTHWPTCRTPKLALPPLLPCQVLSCQVLLPCQVLLLRSGSQFAD
jgi:hypothetical protein